MLGFNSPARVGKWYVNRKHMECNGVTGRVTRMKWWERLERFLLPLQMIKRYYVAIALLIVGTTAALAMLAHVQFLRGGMADTEAQLQRVATQLDSKLPAEFGSLLSPTETQPLSVDERVSLMSQQVQPLVDLLVELNPTLSIACYSADLDRVMAYAPEVIGTDSLSFYQVRTGNSQHPEYSYTVNVVGVVLDPILHLSWPVIRDQQLVGQVLVSAHLADIYADAWEQDKSIILVGLALLVVVLSIFACMFNRFQKGLDHFARAVVQGDPAQVDGLWPELNPLVEAVKQNQDAVRRATAGQFAASVVHEIRNPFTSIRGFSQLLLMSETEPKKRMWLETIIAEVDRVNALISSFLDFAKPGRSSIGIHRVEKLLADITTLAEGACLNANIKLAVAPADKGLDIVCDINQVKQVLLNLVQNAVQAMDGQDNSQVTIETRSDGKTVTIAVNDNGPGIKPDVLSRIFEPFFSTKVHGSGLGLCISRQILEQQGGGLFVETTLGQGSTFKVTLPVAGVVAEKARAGGIGSDYLQYW